MGKTWESVNREELKADRLKLGVAAIAAKYDVSMGAVQHRLRILGLLARDLGLPNTAGPKPLFKPPKAELAKLYKKMTMREIAAHYGVGETIIFTRIKQYQLPPITRSERLKGHKKTDAHRAALSRAHKGKQTGADNPNWKGGITKENNRVRTSIEARIWKLKVLEAANFRCQECGVEHGSFCEHCGTRTTLHAHHIKPFAMHPELRFDPMNGEALCNRCHRLQH